MEKFQGKMSVFQLKAPVAKPVIACRLCTWQLQPRSAFGGKILLRNYDYAGDLADYIPHPTRDASYHTGEISCRNSDGEISRKMSDQF